MSQTTVTTVALVLATIVAMRSTWSPCGISMLSTLTPLGERSRGHSYAETVAWFVLGAVAGGAVLGGVLAGLAAAVGAIGPSARAVEIVVAAAAVVTVASDLDLGGVHLPTIPRQVDENWTGRYRYWVYAMGFGAQIGLGVSTYVMTAGVYLTMVLAAMTGKPLVALLVGGLFGLVRGLAILLGARLRSPEAIRKFHARFEALAPYSLLVAVLAQVDVALVAVGFAAHVVVLAAVGILAIGALLRAGVRTLRPRHGKRSDLIDFVQ